MGKTLASASAARRDPALSVQTLRRLPYQLSYLQVRSEVQQLFVRKLVTHHNLTAQVRPQQAERLFCLDHDRSNLAIHGMLPPFTFYTQAAGTAERR
jgi:hypothetical protein